MLSNFKKIYSAGCYKFLLETYSQLISLTAGCTDPALPKRLLRARLIAIYAMRLPTEAITAWFMVWCVPCFGDGCWHGRSRGGEVLCGKLLCPGEHGVHIYCMTA